MSDFPSDALHDPGITDVRGRPAQVPADAGPAVRDAVEDYLLTVNGRAMPVASAWIGESLLYVLRERLGLPGSKNACEQGECGSCSVLLDGVLVCACCVLAADAVGSAVTTVEGLASGAGAEGQLSEVQRAFVREGAVQCGFCTPGLVVAISDLLERSPAADDLELREAISGNLCRCTGYGRILAAVRSVQEERARARA
jgi:carbon-monoxide dehydrogenase small subunit